MATLSSGASITLDLPAGQKIVVANGGDGIATVGNGNPRDLGDGQAVIGPFQTAQKVLMTATVTLTYEVMDASSGGGGSGEPGPKGDKGDPGDQGPAGADGDPGPAGPGVAAGGTTGQVLSKLSDTDYDTAWQSPSTGSGDVVGPATVSDGTLTVFDGTTGKLLKAATGDGDVQLVGGVASVTPGWGPEVSLASASTVNIGSANSRNIVITGTTGITSFGPGTAGVIRRLRFAATLTITNNATSLIVPTGVNITMNAGDVLEVVSLGGSNWRIQEWIDASITSDVAAKANTASPALTGTPTAPTATAGTNTTQIATTAFTGTAIVNERTATATLTGKTLTTPTINGQTGTLTNTSTTTGIQAPGWATYYTYNPGSIGANQPITFGQWVEYLYASANSNTGGGHSVGLMGYFKKTGAGNPVLGISIEGKYENQHASTQTQQDVFQANVSANAGTLNQLLMFNGTLNGNVGTIDALIGNRLNVSGNTGTITAMIGTQVGVSDTTAGTVSLVYGMHFQNMFTGLSFAPRRWVLVEDAYAPGVSQSSLVCQNVDEITPANGATHTAGPYKRGVILNHSATIAGMTINPPTLALIDKQEFEIWSRSAVTTITWVGTVRAPTTIPAGGYIKLIYSSTNTAWTG